MKQIQKRISEHWYERLVVDVKCLAFEGIVKTKHAIGKRILQDELKFGKAKYGSKRIENLAKDLDTSSRDLWRCMQFAKKCNDITQLSDKTWLWITQKYLPIPKIEKPETPPLPKGKYNVIYADPPWQYDFCKDSSDEIEAHYPTMELEDIKGLKIPTVKDAVLYLWATAPKLKEALEVIEAWGFVYKTHMVWDKDWIGMGYWFRGQHELLLVATKGNVSPPIEKMRVSSVLRERRTKHSKKPDIVREWIEKWHLNQLKIELFARKTFVGWQSWGNEI